ncbi:MAG TPA: hypothetical protein VGM67_20855 [Gemmatimonadaceae bacterium]|jgi:hypothetical protein
MYNRYALLLVAGAAIFTLDASVASAQAKSQKQIPITKEAPGEVITHDTVTVYHTDTLRTEPRVDTIHVTQTNTVTVHDTVVQSVPMVAKHIGGVYLGLGAGPNLPFGAIRTVNEPGAMGQVNLGWQSLNMPLGVRLDGSFTQFSDNADYAALGPRSKMWTGNADLRLNLPIFNHFLGSSVLMTPYLLGGGSYLYYNNLRMQLKDCTGCGYGGQHAVIAGTNSTTAITNGDYHDSWGWNAGGGLAFHAGKKEMFVEARAINFDRGNLYGTSWSVPITFGVNFF